MRHDSMILRYAIPIGISQVYGWSTRPPGFGASHFVGRKREEDEEKT